jgi:hypothetical protein
MLLLFQTVIPPIHVTVQQPPGLPFWETTIISAVVGTFFGISSSVAMEFVKPGISWRLLKKTILKNLDQEFRENYAALLDAVEVMRDYDTVPEDLKKRIELVMAEIRGCITKERYTHFKDTQKALFFEADEGYRLGKFYVLVDRAFQAFPQNRELILVAVGFGKDHAELRGMPEIKPLGIFVQALRTFTQSIEKC